MTVKLIRYRVRDLTEEFECPTCGAPVLQDDRATEDAETLRHFCSSRCAETWRRIDRFCNTQGK